MAAASLCLPFKVAPYLQQVKSWPAEGRHILANHDHNSVIVYQAFNNSIANAAVQANNFHSDIVLKAGYSPTRMTWIKTNFLWMMYRSGWASKTKQERILAIQITRDGFEEILRTASRRGEGSVRLQWDPDHTPLGRAERRRAVQLGIRGDMLNKLSQEFIIKIHDVTEFVKEQSKYCSETCESLMCPVENVYVCGEEAAKQIYSDEPPTV